MLTIQTGFVKLVGVVKGGFVILHDVRHLFKQDAVFALDFSVPYYINNKKKQQTEMSQSNVGGYLPSSIASFFVLLILIYGHYGLRFKVPTDLISLSFRLWSIKSFSFHFLSSSFEPTCVLSFIFVF